VLSYLGGGVVNEPGLRLFHIDRHSGTPGYLFSATLSHAQLGTAKHALNRA
jgi:hypothetical protein